MIHLDLFSGIGGFAYAVDKVWPEAEHIFCDNDKYCQAVLRRHWPSSAIWSDIRELIAQSYEMFINLPTNYNYANAKKQEIPRICQHVSKGDVNPRTCRILWNNQASHMEDTQEKGMQISGQQEIQVREPFLSWNNSERQITEHVGICDKERHCLKKGILREMWVRRFNERWENGNSGTPQRLQQTTGSGVALPKMSPQMAQEEQINTVGGLNEQIITNTKHGGHVHGKSEIKPTEGYNETLRELASGIRSPFILTGGFPCQGFSQAGKRRGKSDDRFLWPAMLECIRLFKPAWVIAENVYGLLNIESGMVFEQVCTDMEGAGYQVWPFIVPACAVNAPHRRDRVWFVAHSKRNGRIGTKGTGSIGEAIQEEQARKDNTIDIEGAGCLQWGEPFDRRAWQNNWKQVALATCIRRVDDGIPNGMDNISGARQRTERLKMLGNSIVPQVAIEIMRAIKDVDG